MKETGDKEVMCSTRGARGGGNTKIVSKSPRESGRQGTTQGTDGEIKPNPPQVTLQIYSAGRSASARGVKIPWVGDVYSSVIPRPSIYIGYIIPFPLGVLSLFYPFLSLYHFIPPVVLREDNGGGSEY